MKYYEVPGVPPGLCLQLNPLSPQSNLCHLEGHPTIVISAIVRLYNTAILQPLVKDSVLQMCADVQTLQVRIQDEVCEVSEPCSLLTS